MCNQAQKKFEDIKTDTLDDAWAETKGNWVRHLALKTDCKGYEDPPNIVTRPVPGIHGVDYLSQGLYFLFYILYFMFCILYLFILKNSYNLKE